MKTAFMSLVLLVSTAWVLAAHPLVTPEFPHAGGWEEGVLRVPFAGGANRETGGFPAEKGLSAAGDFPANPGPGAGGSGVGLSNLEMVAAEVLHVGGFFSTADSGPWIFSAFARGTFFPAEFRCWGSTFVSLTKENSLPQAMGAPYGIYGIQANPSGFLWQRLTFNHSPEQFGQLTFRLPPMVPLSPADMAGFRIPSLLESTPVRIPGDNFILAAIPEPVKVTLILGLGIFCWQIRRATARR